MTCVVEILFWCWKAVWLRANGLSLPEASEEKDSCCVSAKAGLMLAAGLRIKDYCLATTLHGFTYLVEPITSVFEKLLWAVAIMTFLW